METNTATKIEYTAGEFVGNIRKEGKKTALYLADEIDRNIQQTQAIIDVVIANTIKESMAYQNFNDRTIATLLWQVEGNLESLQELVDAQWKAIKSEHQ